MQEEYISLDDIEIRPYLAEVRRRHGIIDLLALPNMRDLPPMQIETLFVQPLLAKGPVSTSLDPENWPKGQTLFQALEESSRIILLGDPGSGKTTLASWLAWRLSSGAFSTLPEFLQGRLPIPCVLRELDPSKFDSIVDIGDIAISIAKKLVENVSNKTLAAISRWVNSKNYVLILDGIDEIPVERRNSVSRWLQQAARDQAYAIATSRIVGYDDFPVDRTEETSLNIIQSKPGNYWADFTPQRPANIAIRAEELRSLSPKPTWTHVLKISTEKLSNVAKGFGESSATLHYLMPFDQNRVSAFVHNWYLQRTGNQSDAREKAEDLLSALEQSDVTRELARTPNLLSLIAIVHRERANLPDGKAWLYKEIANAYLNTIDQHRKIKGEDIIAQYSWETKENWLAYVGFQMQLQRKTETHGNSGVLIDESHILQWLEQAMTLSGVPNPTDVASDFLKWVARRSGLLLPRGEGRYAFVHLSFQEYFCARFIATRIVSPTFARSSKSSDESVSAELLQEWSNTYDWREVFVYLFELVAGERDTEWLSILTKTLFSQDDRVIKRPCAELAVKVLNNNHVPLEKATKVKVLKQCSSLAIAMAIGPAEDVSHPVFDLLIKYNLLFAHSSSESDVPLTSYDELILNDELLILALSGHDLRTWDFRKFKGLQFIALVDSKISDLSQFSLLEDLGALDLTGSEFSDTGIEFKLHNVSILRLAHSQVKSLNFLSGSKRLLDLNIDSTSVADLSPLANTRELLWLSADKCPIEDLTPLAKLKKLRNLSLSHSKVKDYDALSKLSSLAALHLSDSSIRNIKFTSKLKSLVGLDISQTEVSDLSPLRDLKKLKLLYISGLNIERFPHFDNLELLTHLDVSDTKLKDATDLIYLANLGYLNVANTSLIDLSPLRELKNLKELVVSEGMNVEAVAKANRQLEIRHR